MLKIGIVCYPTFGGSGVVATELGKALARKGHEVHFITYSQPVRLDADVSNIYFHEVRFESYPLFEYQPYELALTSKMVDVVKFEKLDLLHVHYAIPHASAAYMAQRILEDQGYKIPFITTLHGTDITLVGKDDSYEPVITFSINHSNAVTAVSESLKADTFKHFKITREVQVIPNFVCNEQFPKSPDKELKHKYAPNGEKVLMHISNFREVKRVEDVVRIFDTVRKTIPSKLILVGDGPERHKIETLCRQLGTCNDIRFLGKLKSTETILSIADLFLLTSETESFGLAALEAMACGVPVISTNSGGIPEVNINNKTGFLSNVGDVDDMAKNSLKLLTNNTLHAEFRVNALQTAETFDLEKVLPLYENLYEKVIKQNK